LGSKGFRLDFRPHKVYFFELSIKFYIKSSPKTSKLVIFHLKAKKEPQIRMGATRRNLFLRSYKNFMTNKFRFWVPKAFDWTLDPIKCTFLISAKNFTSNQAQKHQNWQYSIWKWKRSQKFVRNLFLSSYKNFMTNKFRFWVPKAFDWTLDL
jgi:hypothetical protein